MPRPVAPLLEINRAQVPSISTDRDHPAMREMGTAPRHLDRLLLPSASEIQLLAHAETLVERAATDSKQALRN